jgi:hypothetical protein
MVRVKINVPNKIKNILSKDDNFARDALKHIAKEAGKYEQPKVTKDDLQKRLTHALENVNPSYGGCKIGDVMVVWVGAYQMRSDRKKPQPPNVASLRKHIVARANDVPWTSKDGINFDRKLLAASPTWQTFVKLWPKSSRQALKIYEKTEGSKGKGREITYEIHHGKTTQGANSQKVARFLLDNCDPDEVKANLENREQRVESEKAQQKS